IAAGDSITFSAEALDAAGRPVPNAIIRFVAQGGQGEGGLDSTGKLVASSVGKMPINVVAMVPGTRPVIEKITVLMVPGPATRVGIQTKIGKLVAGQQLQLAALAFARMNDRTDDPIRWTSKQPAIARIDNDGVVTAVRSGVATLV